jgi:two-component system, NarL family, nitrate/nitrite response regulator NarL
LRVRLQVADPRRRAELAALVVAAGHVRDDDTPDVVLCDGASAAAMPEVEAPVILLTGHTPRGDLPAGLLAREVSAGQLDAAIRAVAAGLTVRSAHLAAEAGFTAAEESAAALTPRELEILALVGLGLSNKAIARRLDISVHTVKFHMEALFAKLEVTSRAGAVAKGLRAGLLEI